MEFLSQFNLGYLLITEPRWNGGRGNLYLQSDKTFALPVRNKWIKEVYKGLVIGSSSFTPATAEAALQEGIYDAIAFGRLFISNPDLVERIRLKLPLNIYDTFSFYVRDPVKGYIDYPRFEEAQKFPLIAPHDIGKLPSPAKL